MYSIRMFYQIHDCKNNQMTISQTSRHLGFSYPTVKKYWTMTEEEYLKQRERSGVNRKQKCDKYREFIIGKLKFYNYYSAAQIYEFIKQENNGEIDIGESTLRRYLAGLRKELGIKPKEKKRDYQAVVEKAPGEQAQMDYGEYLLAGPDMKKKRVYFIVILLSYSRYKYVEFSDTKFTAFKTVQALQNAFESFGGVPGELVIDQDAALVKKEYYGEVEFTQNFQYFLNQLSMRVRVCHKADPETKGKVENCVQYVKKNFLNGRDYKGIEPLNRECRKWLEAVANSKKHQTTKEAPVKRLKYEQKALKQMPKHKITYEIISQQVNKDNTITLGGNRYDVPKGSYNSEGSVLIKKYEERIEVYSETTGELLAEHSLSKEKGRLITLDGRQENESSYTNGLIEKVKQKLDGIDGAAFYIDQVLKNHPDFKDLQMKALLEVLGEVKISEEALKIIIYEMMEKKNFEANDLALKIREQSIRKEHWHFYHQEANLPKEVEQHLMMETVSRILDDPRYASGNIKYYIESYASKLVDIEGNPIQ